MESRNMNKQECQKDLLELKSLKDELFKIIIEFDSKPPDFWAKNASKSVSMYEKLEDIQKSISNKNE